MFQLRSQCFFEAVSCHSFCETFNKWRCSSFKIVTASVTLSEELTVTSVGRPSQHTNSPLVTTLVVDFVFIFRGKERK